MMAISAYYGLRWEEDRLGYTQPRWTVEPDLSHIERIARRELHLDDAAACVAEFFAQGGFNKLYLITTNGGKWLMRVALPVDPYRKTASEVSTMRFVRKNTSIPVPDVVAHEASNDNDLRFEWILMQFMPGVELEKHWRQLSMQQKEDMTKKLAQYQAELFSRDDARFRSIGNIYQSNSDSQDIGSIVSMSFFWRSGSDKGPSTASNRGPFPNSHAWLQARLHLMLATQSHLIATARDAISSAEAQHDSDNEDIIEDAEIAHSLATRLLALLPTIFPPDEPPGPTTLFHDDLHENNILVDPDTGAITAILDWECVSFLPLWMACQPPALLNDRIRTEEPLRETYGKYDPEFDDGKDGECRREYNEGMNGLYWEHKLEFEKGVLKKVFVAEMERLRPEWVREWKDGEGKRDFEMAVLGCDEPFSVGRIGKWLDSWEREGKRGYSLREDLNR
jgi:aminoglycoside phosphotransferase (APT) family kinase protein